MARLRPRRIAYCAILYLTLTAAASGQGALYKLFRAGYYLSKTTDSALTYNLNKVTTKAWLDSLYSAKDTVVIGMPLWDIDDNTDTGYVTFFGNYDQTQRGGFVWSANMFANATGIWELNRITIRHSYVDSTGTEQVRDTVAQAVSQATIQPGSALFACYAPASSFGAAVSYHSGEPMQTISIWVAAPNQSLNASGVRAMQAVHLPLILVPGIGQVGAAPDHIITVTATFEVK